MAVKKKVEEEIVLQEEQVKDIGQKEDLQIKLDEKDKELADIKAKFEEMQKMMLSMQNAILSNSSNSHSVNVDMNEKVNIKSNVFGRLILIDREGNEALDFADSDEIVSIPVRMLDIVMTGKNKKFFKDGLVAFEDDKYYDLYNIEKPYEISEANISSLLNGNYDEAIQMFDKLTHDGKNDLIKNTIFWKAIRLFAKGLVTNISATQLVASYFGVDNIQNSIYQCQYAKDMGFLS